MTSARPTRDVAIIGGGIAGAAIAAFLAADGAAVTLVERTRIAAAASGRNSGVVQHPYDPVLVRLYRESLACYRALARDAVAGAPFRLDDDPAGLLLVGAGDEGERLATVQARAWAAAHPGVGPEVVAGRALRALEPSLGENLAACRLAVGYPVAPASATRAYAALAAARGANVFLGQAARPVVRDGVASGIDVDGTFVAAGAVVVAAGPWSAGLLADWFAAPIVPVWGVVAAIELDEPPRHVLEEVEIDIGPPEAGDPGRPRPGSSDDRTIDFSLVTVAGASALGSTFLPAEPDPARYVDRLRERGSRFVPGIRDARLAGVRACARPVSADRRPLVGRVPGIDRAFVCAGHGPWGISTGPATSRLVADLVLGRSPAIPPELDPGRFGVTGSAAADADRP